MLKPARILLGGPELLVLEGLRAILEKHFADVEVASDMNEFSALLRTGIFYVAVFDTNWADWFEQRIRNLIKETASGMTSIALVSSDHPMPSTQSGGESALRVMKSRPSFALLETIAAALEDLSTTQPPTKFELGLPPVGRSDVAVNIEQLTRRQQQILDLVVTGKPLKIIANDLNISVRTVEFHKYKLMKFLGVSTTAELVRVAVTNLHRGPKPRVHAETNSR